MSWFVAFNVFQLIAFLIRIPGVNDFRFFYAAARIGLTYGWSRIYDQHLQVIFDHTPGLPFTNPPPLAWLVAPLTELPYWWAYAIWMAAVLAALVVAAWSVERRLIHLASAGGLLPAFYAVSGGQVAPILLLTTVGAASLLRRDKGAWAGLLLSVFIIKPHLGVLILPCLLAAGYLRAAVAHGSAMAAWIIASSLSLGSGGLLQFKQVLMESASPLTTQWSLTRLGAVGVGLILLFVLVAIVAARRHPGKALAIATLGSLVVNVHLTPSDFVLMLPAIWYLRPPAAAGALWMATWFAPAFSLPVMVAGALSLLLLSCGSRPDRRDHRYPSASGGPAGDAALDHGRRARPDRAGDRRLRA